MPKRRKAITFSLLPEMEEQLQQAVREDRCTTSDLIGEAARPYMDERGVVAAEAQGVAVTRLVEQHHRYHRGQVHVGHLGRSLRSTATIGAAG